MQAWLEGIAGPEFAPALMWTVIALIALLVLLVVVRIVRGLTFGTFVAGGRNRKARLAVMDATAVDSQRRLVLVRRDDVEHLILIGGPTDVVVEQNIRLVAPATARRPPDEHSYALHSQPEATPRVAVSRPVAPAPTAVAQPAAAPRPTPAPVERKTEFKAPAVTPPSQSASAAAAAPASAATYRPATAPRHSEPLSASPATPQTNARPSVTTPIAPQAVAVPSPNPTDALDNALREELQVSLGNESSSAAPSLDHSLDEEMSRLLSDLSAEKRR